MDACVDPRFSELLVRLYGDLDRERPWEAFLEALAGWLGSSFATLIITVLPFASIGGVVGLFVTGEYLSVPASVGFIALWGIAVLNGVVLVSYIRGLREEGRSVREAVAALMT